MKIYCFGTGRELGFSIAKKLSITEKRLFSCKRHKWIVFANIAIEYVVKSNRILKYHQRTMGWEDMITGEIVYSHEMFHPMVRMKIKIGSGIDPYMR